MFDRYFDDWEVRPQFKREYISLWPSWLGKEKLHLLDEVSKEEWSRFNLFISSISQKFKLGVADCHAGKVTFPSKIETTLSNHTDSMNKDASSFSKFVIPELQCVITEEWDYTYIIWHKNNGAVEALEPYIANSKLKHFSD